jgi:hypothetical protein
MVAHQVVALICKLRPLSGFSLIILMIFGDPAISVRLQSPGETLTVDITIGIGFTDKKQCRPAMLVSLKNQAVTAKTLLDHFIRHIWLVEQLQYFGSKFSWHLN